jgi:hypothetical protein
MPFGTMQFPFELIILQTATGYYTSYGCDIQKTLVWEVKPEHSLLTGKFGYWVVAKLGWHHRPFW